MPATQEIESIKKVGLIAGGGDLPVQILSDCDSRGIETFIIAFDKHTDKSLVSGRGHIWTHLGSVGTIIKTLKENGIRDLILAGSIKRPSFFDLKPDLKAIQILSRIGMGALGDNSLLTALRKELEHEGFRVHGVQKFSSRLMATEGVLGSISPQEADEASIELGIKTSQQIGRMDIGQSVIVQGGVVIAVEAAEGTDAMIERSAKLLKGGRGGILVKTCKPQQDKELDLPTIGTGTIHKAYKAGLCGVIVQAHHTIILDAKAVADQANKYKMFVVAVSIPT